MNKTVKVTMFAFFAAHFSPDILAVSWLWITTFALFVAACVMQLLLHRNGRVRIKAYYLKWYLPFIAFCFLSRFWARNDTAASDGMLILYVVFVTFTLLSLLIDTWQDVYNLMKITLCALSVFFLDLLLNINWANLFNSRLGLGNINQNWNSNDLAMKLMLFVFLSSVLIKNKQIKQKKLIYALDIVFAFFILMSGSRKGIIGLALLLLLYYAFEKRGRAMKAIFIALTMVGLLYICMMSIPQLYNIVGYRFEGLFFGTSTEGSFIGRSRMIEWGFGWFMDKPIFGYGLNNFRILSPYNAYAHNNYIELLVDIGLVGTMLYYAVFVQLFRGMQRLKKNRSVVLSLAIVMLIFDIMMVSYTSLVWMLMLFICLYMININKTNERREIAMP